MPYSGLRVCLQSADTWLHWWVFMMWLAQRALSQACDGCVKLSLVRVPPVGAVSTSPEALTREYGAHIRRCSGLPDRRSAANQCESADFLEPGRDTCQRALMSGRLRCGLLQDPRCLHSPSSIFAGEAGALDRRTMDRSRRLAVH